MGAIVLKGSSRNLRWQQTDRSRSITMKKHTLNFGLTSGSPATAVKCNIRSLTKQAQQPHRWNDGQASVKLAVSASKNSPYTWLYSTIHTPSTKCQYNHAVQLAAQWTRWRDGATIPRLSAAAILLINRELNNPESCPVMPAASYTLHLRARLTGTACRLNAAPGLSAE